MNSVRNQFEHLIGNACGDIESACKSMIIIIIYETNKSINCKRFVNIPERLVPNILVTTLVTPFRTLFNNVPLDGLPISSDRTLVRGLSRLSSAGFREPSILARFKACSTSRSSASPVTPLVISSAILIISLSKLKSPLSRSVLIPSAPINKYYFFKYSLLHL